MLNICGPGFVTRPVGVADMTALLELYRQCADFLSLGPDPIPSESMVLRDLSTTLPEGGSYLGLYLDDGRLAGVLDVIPSGFEGDTGTAFIELLMIGAPYRGSGLGERVFKALESVLAARGTRSVRAGVQINNPRALAFWQRMGFQVISGPELQSDGTVCLGLQKELTGAADE